MTRLEAARDNMHQALQDMAGRETVAEDVAFLLEAVTDLVAAKVMHAMSIRETGDLCG